MAVSAGSVCEVDAATGNDLNAGWFNPYRASAGTDQTYSTGQAVTNITDLVSTGTTCTSVANPFGAADVGNYIRIPAGTGLTAGIYEIISVSAVTATLYSSIGAGSQSGGTIKKGGSLATPTQANIDWTVAGCTVYIKYNASPYSMAATITGHGGCNSLRGYQTTREDVQPGNGLNRPTLQASGTSYALISCGSNQGNLFKNLILDSNNKTGGIGVSNSSGSITLLNNCKIMNCKAGAINCSANVNSLMSVMFCEITGCTLVSAISGCTGFVCYACDIHDNSTTNTQAVVLAVNSVFIACNAYSNTGSGGNSGVAWGCYSTNNATVFINCTANNNSVAGWVGNNGNSEDAWVNCSATNNGSFGFIGNTGGISTLLNGQNMYNCSYYNNPANIVNSNAANTAGTVVLSADPYVASASGNFALNANSGGGPLLKGTGAPSTFPAGTTASARDINAAQAAAGASGSTASPGVSRIIAGGSQ